MLTRRSFFSLLPMSFVGLAGSCLAETPPETVSSTTEPSVWVEMTCHALGSPEYGVPICGQRFKTLRIASGYPVCPKCGRAQDISRPDLREKFMGIPV